VLLVNPARAADSSLELIQTIAPKGNSDTGKEMTSVAIPKDINDLHYDAKRKKLYASCGEGFLAVIGQTSPDKYELLEKIETVKEAKTLLFTPEMSRLYLAIPRQTDKDGPEIRVYKIKS
jgi:hypothetical protein